MSVVILATNDSPSCRRAVDRAAGLFEGATVVVAMVVPGGCPRRDLADEAGAVRTATNGIALDAAAQAVVGACETLGSRARPALLDGDPVTALCDMARAERAHAIVVGSLGRNPVAATLWGSIGAELLENAPCPVVELGGAT